MLPALLSWYTHVDAPGGGPGASLPWLRTKIIYLRWALRDESALVDGATLLLIVAVPALLLARRRLRIDLAMGLVAVALFALYVIVPTAVNNAFYADLRFLPPRLRRGVARLPGHAAEPARARRSRLAPSRCSPVASR